MRILPLIAVVSSVFLASGGAQGGEGESGAGDADTLTI